MKVKPALLALVLALPLAGMLAQAQAQTTAPAAPKPAKAAAKPVAKAAKPAKPAADGKTLSLGGNNISSGPLLTRDELRACLQHEDDIRTRLGQVDAARAVLDQEKLGITTTQTALRSDREGINALKLKIDDLGERMRAYTARVDALNALVIEHNADTRVGTPPWERRRKEISAEREAVEVQRAGLDAEKGPLSEAAQAAVADFNAKATALDTRVTDWNSRNAKLNDAGARCV